MSCPLSGRECTRMPENGRGNRTDSGNKVTTGPTSLAVGRNPADPDRHISHLLTELYDPDRPKEAKQEVAIGERNQEADKQGDKKGQAGGDPHRLVSGDPV